MKTFNVPTREEVTIGNQAIFDQLEKSIGFVPNLFATFAHSETALENYLSYSKAKTSLSAKEKEVVNLAVSQVNECAYCLAAHTTIAGMNGFDSDQILELRTGGASFNEKLNALAGLAKNITENRGRASQEKIKAFYAVGYDQGNLIDTIALIGDKTIMNYLHNTTQVAVDFPVAPSLTLETV